ncbi:3-phosphoshikimate 1-carboxyvinyltransferase [Corallincola platygyrae]|uniref:3-phosphoshikimate 1-carboxyvinyltransferase n=1 Tax=Corallincola platygyrae TaxID=1193278 RepID=A0ABW4XG53_9GAMM
MESMKNRESKTAGSLIDDPVILRLFERMPHSVQESFTEEQLMHLKVAVGSRGWGEHAVDVRGSFRGWRHRYYYVMLFGRNRRHLTPGQKRIHNLISAAMLTGFVCVGLLIGLLGLYLLKSAAGIDLFPDHSLGIWDWFNSN